MTLLVIGVALILWGLWGIWRAPALAARYECLVRSHPEWTGTRSQEWMSPVAWRVYGVIWCCAGIWVVTARLPA